MLIFTLALFDSLVKITKGVIELRVMGLTWDLDKSRLGWELVLLF
jgi:hypothetical protein